MTLLWVSTPNKTQLLGHNHPRKDIRERSLFIATGGGGGGEIIRFRCTEILPHSASVHCWRMNENVHADLSVSVILGHFRGLLHDFKIINWPMWKSEWELVRTSCLHWDWLSVQVISFCLIPFLSDSNSQILIESCWFSTWLPHLVSIKQKLLWVPCEISNKT